MAISRRQFLSLSSGGMISSFCPPLLAKNSLPATDYLTQVIKHLKRYQSNNQQLTLLYPNGSLGNLQPVVNAFQKISNTKVVLVEASLDSIASELILSQKLQSQNYDIALPPSFAIPDLVEANAIVDLTDLAQEFEPSGMFDESLYRKGDYHKQRLYGYQADGDAYIMFYNMNFLDQENKKHYEDTFGKAYSTPITWSELEQQMAFFNKPEQDCYGGNLFRNQNYVAWEFWVRIHAKGVLPVMGDMTPNINQDAAVATVEEMIQAQEYLPPNIEQKGLFENFSSFAKGNKYCNVGWGGTQKYLQHNNSIIKDKLKFSPTLGSEINGQKFYLPFFNWGWNYVVSQKAKNPLLAYLFCLFASTPEISTNSVSKADGFFDPHREEHFHSKEIESLYGPHFLAAQKNSLLNAIPDFYLRGQGLYLDALKHAVYAACLKRIPIKYALDRAAERWEKITEKLGKNEQQLQWHYLKKQYPEKYLLRLKDY